MDPGDRGRGPRVGRRPRTAERPPLPALVVAGLAAAGFALPLAGLLWRAPWSGAWHELRRSETVDALELSLLTSVLATAAALVFGLPLAWVQARWDYPGRRLVRALTTLPMVLPPVVGGTALLLAFGRRGLAGPALRSVGVHLPFSTTGAVAAEAFVAMPFLVLTAEAAFRAGDRRLEEAARTLGAGPWAVFRRVTLPLVRPSVIAGAVLCWARALGEFGATITFAGNLPGRTQTLPLFVYVTLEGAHPETAIVSSLLLLVASLAVLVGLRDRWLGAL
ncbi:MAG: ABC transporter permease [Acidimicrobiales bacterium]